MGRAKSKTLCIRMYPESYKKIKTEIQKSKLAQDEFLEKLMEGKTISTSEDNDTLVVLKDALVDENEKLNDILRFLSNTNYLINEAAMLGYISQFEKYRQEVLAIWQSIR